MSRNEIKYATEYNNARRRLNEITGKDLTFDEFVVLFPELVPISSKKGAETDYIVADEKARKRFIEITGKYIRYGHFRELYPEFVPSKIRRVPIRAKYAKSFNSPHKNGGSRQRQLTDKDDEIIKEEYINGTKYEVIAERLCTSVETIRNHLERMGLIDRKHGRNKAWSMVELETLKMMNIAGSSNKEIAEALKRSEKSIAMKKSELKVLKSAKK